MSTNIIGGTNDTVPWHDVQPFEITAAHVLADTLPMAENNNPRGGKKSNKAKRKQSKQSRKRNR